MSALAAAIVWSGNSTESILADQLLLAEPQTQIALIAPPDLELTRLELPQTELHIIRSQGAGSSQAVAEVLTWFAQTGAQELVWATRSDLALPAAALRRLRSALRDSGAPFVYGDYQELDGDVVQAHPLIDWQLGSVRDDFDFGPLLLMDGNSLGEGQRALADGQGDLQYGGLYQLRLSLCQQGTPIRLAEPICSVPQSSAAGGEEAHFAYVNPRNRTVQLEMEQVCTEHLRRIGAWLESPRAPLEQGGDSFPVEASVIIPVRNRAGTIAQAVDSALAQKTEFEFNIIVVDNHSDDGTGDILAKLAQGDKRLIHRIPQRLDLGIGGCWNEAVYCEACGRYAVQLDSDDLYSDESVLQKIVSQFRDSNCAMVVGSYTIVDFKLQQIPPGLIDHREWTANNGHNNALRIHGLGAPRAFHVPTLRQFGFPNVSYGEDYAVALRLSREFPVGRIYDSLYWCRRWEDNTDHALDLATANRYAVYKDRLRTVEILARQRANVQNP